jgi:hypothetical protein
MAFSSILSVYLGQDANFDLRNYHIFNAWSFLLDSHNTFLAPVGEQSYFNPLLDLPYFFMVAGPLNNFPVIVSALQGLYAGLLLFIILRLNLHIFYNRPFISFTATFIGFFGASTYSQVGTTFNEVQLAVIVLAGLLVLVTTKPSEERLIPFLAAGTLAGAATGLKLTAATYAIALLATLIATQQPNKLLPIKLLHFILGCFIGFLLTSIYWFYTTYELFQNPIFPYYNAIFRSEFYPAFNPSDDRFKAHGFSDVILIPFHLAAGSVGVSSEIYVRDPRFLVTGVSILFICAHLFARKDFEHDIFSIKLRPTFGLLVFFVIGYLVWVLQFGILRYAIPTEMVSGSIIVTAICLIAGPANWRSSVLSLVSATAILFATTPPDWGRISYGSKVVEVAWPALPSSVRIVIGGGPVSYTLPFADVQIRDVINPRLAHPGYKLLEHLQKRVSEGGPPIFVLFNSPVITEGVGSLVSLGLRWDTQKCRSLRTNFEQNISLCEAIPVR